MYVFVQNFEKLVRNSGYTLRERGCETYLDTLFQQPMQAIQDKTWILNYLVT
jgi:hypothetical protein